MPLIFKNIILGQGTVNCRQYLVNMVARGINLFRHQAHKRLLLHTIVGKTIDPEINTYCFLSFFKLLKFYLRQPFCSILLVISRS